MTDFDSESNEGNVSGLARIALQMKRARQSNIKLQEQMLTQLRGASMGFNDISDQIYTKLSVRISPNKLIKRYQKIIHSHA